MLSGLLLRFRGTESVLLAAAILGATVMPHAVYMHSGLVLTGTGTLTRGRTAACCCASPAGTWYWRWRWPAP